MLRRADLKEFIWVRSYHRNCRTNVEDDLEVEVDDDLEVEVEVGIEFDVDLDFEFRWRRCRDSSLLSGSETCMSERSEFACFPLSSELSREPEGHCLRSPFSCLLLFGEAKRSKRPPGRPRRGDRSKN